MRGRAGPAARTPPSRTSTTGADGNHTTRRYLLESETLLFAVRRHWTVLVGSGVVYLGVLLVSVALIVLGHGSGAVQGFGAAVLVVASLWFGWHVGDWWVERFTVTDRRVLLVTGLLTRRVAIMPLRKVTDLTYERSVAGRVLGYGAFVMESAGQHQALSRIDYLPHPDRLYQQMSDLLFGSGRADRDPDDDDQPRRTVRTTDRPTRAPRPEPPTRATALTTPLPRIARERGNSRLPRGRDDS